MGCQDKELSILFTDDKHISEINKNYLKREGPTDVISFSFLGKEEERMNIPILGDIVISVDTAKRESEETGEDIETTICRLIIHGILHILGYDHEGSKEEAQKMRKEEERLLSIMKMKEVG